MTAGTCTVLADLIDEGIFPTRMDTGMRLEVAPPPDIVLTAVPFQESLHIGATVTLFFDLLNRDASAATDFALSVDGGGLIGLIAKCVGTIEAGLVRIGDLAAGVTRTVALTFAGDEAVGNGALSVQPMQGDRPVGAAHDLPVIQRDAIHVLDGTDADDLLSVPTFDGNLRGGNGADTLCGADDRDLLEGDAGADLLEGDAGADLLVGGAGADTLDGGAGNDTLHAEDLVGPGAALAQDLLRGGDGDDLFVVIGPYGGVESGDTVYGNAGSATLHFVETGEDGDPGSYGHVNLRQGYAYIRPTFRFPVDDMLTLASIENVTWSGGRADIFGSPSANRLVLDDSPTAGLNAYGKLDGRAGADTLTGAQGDDTLLGGQGADDLQGGDGADVLSGGKSDTSWPRVRSETARRSRGFSCSNAFTRLS